MIFKLRADCEIEADGLDAAFQTIADHFMALANVEHVTVTDAEGNSESYTPSEWPIVGGEITLERAE